MIVSWDLCMFLIFIMSHYHFWQKLSFLFKTTFTQHQAENLKWENVNSNIIFNLTLPNYSLTNLNSLSILSSHIYLVSGAGIHIIVEKEGRLESFLHHYFYIIICLKIIGSSSCCEIHLITLTSCCWILTDITFSWTFLFLLFQIF